MSTQPDPPHRKGMPLIVGIAIGFVAALMMVIVLLGLVWAGITAYREQQSPLVAPPPPPVARSTPLAPRSPLVPPPPRSTPVVVVDQRDPMAGPSSVAPVFHIRSPSGNLLDGKSFTLETSAKVRAADGYLVVDDSKELRIPGPLSISMWFNARSLDHPMTLCSRALNGPPWGFPFASWLVRVNDPIHLEASLTGFAGYSPSTWTVPRLEPNRWYHAVMTYDGRTKKLFLNGEPQRALFSGKLDHTVPTRYVPGRAILIGAAESQSPVGDIFDGAIADLRIFNRALPEDEILTMYSVSPLSPEGGQGNRLRE